MTATTQTSQILERLEQHQKNKNNIINLQNNNHFIELDLVKIMIKAGEYGVLDINLPKLKNFMRMKDQ
jgi:hypothetical protein